MARPQKKGLDYFPIDVTMDRTDDIELLEAKYPINGFKVLVKLYMKIYGDEGYYLEWNERTSLLLAKRVNVDINEVNDIINDLVEWNVFDKELFENYKILTSQRVQTTYLEATKKRKEITFFEEYLLLKTVNSNNNLINDNINLINVGIYPQSKVKKSKVKKSKEDIIHKHGEYSHVLLTEKQFESLKTDFPNDYENMIKNLDEYLETKNVSYKNHSLVMRKWKSKDLKEKQDDDISNWKPSTGYAK